MNATTPTKARPFYVYAAQPGGAVYVATLTATGAVSTTTPSIAHRRYFTHAAALAVCARNGERWMIGNAYNRPA